MNSRDDIRDFIVSLEQQFPLNEWRFGTLKIWPYLRIWLFFYMIDSLEGATHKRKTDQQREGAKRDSIWVRTLIRPFNYFFFLNKLRPKKLVLVGSRAHRVGYKGVQWNRFFDSLIDRYNLQGKTVQVEYDNFNYAGYPNAKSLLNYHKARIGFTRVHGLMGRFRKKPLLHTPSYDAFIGAIEQSRLSKDFHFKIKPGQLRNLCQMLTRQIAFFRRILKKVQPEKLIVLSFYSNTTSFGLVAAANSLGIPTVELQHGPMSQAHLAYGSWNTVPEDGYDLLPRKYWCWEESTLPFLDGWKGPGKKLYEAFAAGHPWMEYVQEDAQVKDTSFVLYTLQPEPVTFEMIFTPAIINLIREQRYKWYIRLHPRQVNVLDDIRQFLAEHEILDLVNITEATNANLPALLKKTMVHITHSSGCVLEAYISGVPTIIINKIGTSYYSNLIASGHAFGLDYKDANFETEFYHLCETTTRMKNNHKKDYHEIVAKLLG